MVLYTECVAAKGASPRWSSPDTPPPDRGLPARAKGLVHAVDRAQQTRPWLAVAVATWKKFSDNKAGNLAALIAYYAFASLFPLLLVAYTILDLIARSNANAGRKKNPCAVPNPSAAA